MQSFGEDTRKRGDVGRLQKRHGDVKACRKAVKWKRSTKSWNKSKKTLQVVQLDVGIIPGR